MKKNLIQLIAVVSLMITHNLSAQNVGINSTGANPDASAMLDISSTNTGVLLPRVALTQTTSASPVSSPATSLMIYNTATVNDVTPGYYYWDGAKWVRMGAGKFTIGYSNGAGTATGTSTNYYYITSTGSLSNTGQATTPNMSGAAPVQNVFLYTATSTCTLNKLNIWLSFGSSSKNFTIDCYKYTQVANATSLPSGTALITTTTITSSATALGNTYASINGNNTILQPGDVVCLMIKFNGTNNNLYLNGSLEFSNQ